MEKPVLNFEWLSNMITTARKGHYPPPFGPLFMLMAVLLVLIIAIPILAVHLILYSYRRKRYKKAMTPDFIKRK